MTDPSCDASIDVRSGVNRHDMFRIGRRQKAKEEVPIEWNLLLLFPLHMHAQAKSIWRGCRHHAAAMQSNDIYE